ncbi:MAG TPA: hypothetical protein VLV15_10585, partial [Dongiaceae bacterium]|nr:hypothetical protein [Dongiaceae bacterium]
MSNAPGYACLFRAAGADPAALVALAADFSPRYERLTHPTGDLVVIDISGLERIFSGERLRPCRAEDLGLRGEASASVRGGGGAPPQVEDVGAFHAIGWALAREATARGLRVNVALAGTWTAAVVLAQVRPSLTVIEPGGGAAALAPLPVGVLATTSELVAVAPVFRAWGVRTLGELAALPRADLVSRFGRRAVVWQAMARGDDVRPLVPMLAEERFESSVELEWPIEELEPLSFVLTRLLEPLSTRLERRDRGAAVLHVHLRLVTREVHARRLELPTPIRDVRTLRTLALLDLESHPAPAPIDRVAIVIDPTPGPILQHTLFTRPVPTAEQISTLLARLHALMGQERVGAAATVDSYRPGAFEMRPFATDHELRRDRRDGRDRG